MNPVRAMSNCKVRSMWPVVSIDVLCRYDAGSVIGILAHGRSAQSGSDVMLLPFHSNEEIFDNES